MTPETIGVKAAGENLPLLIDRVDAYGQEFTITRHGRPVAVLLNVDELAALRGEIARLSGKGAA